MTNDLLPCPFCGTAPRIGETEGGEMHISCTNRMCEITMMDDMDWGNTDHDATGNVISKWNTRTPNKSAEVDLDALALVNDKIQQCQNVMESGAAKAFHKRDAAEQQQEWILIRNALSCHLATGIQYNISGKDDYDAGPDDWKTVEQLIAAEKTIQLP